VAAVLTGFVVFFIIIRMLAAFVGTLDAGGAVMNFLLLSVTWSVAGAVIAGYTTARIAASHEFPHVAALALLMVVIGIVSMRQEGIAHPGWYQTTIAGCGPIAAMLGAAIRLLTKRNQTENRNTSAPANRR
jgi:hypothetical protein